jgi:hypothetical protein
VTWSSAQSAESYSSSPLLGWRVWRLALERGGVVRLRSAVFDERWEPGGEVRASCPSGHRAPAPACVCGLYAVSSPARAVRYLVGRNDADVVHRVVGEVALWGVVVEAENGWRAARAYPAAIWLPPRATSGHPVDLDELEDGLAAYGVPVVRLDNHEPRALAYELEAAVPV